MIFSRLGRTLSRSSSSRFQISGVSGRCDGRSACLKDPIRQWQHAREGDCGLGFSRSYLTLIGADKGFASKKVLLSDLGFVLASSRIRRLYSSEAPKKKNYENYYPNDKKKIPKGNDQRKTDSKEKEK